MTTGYISRQDVRESADLLEELVDIVAASSRYGELPPTASGFQQVLVSHTWAAAAARVALALRQQLDQSAGDCGG